MSWTFSTWIKAAIMAARSGSPQVIQHLVHNLRLPSSRNRHLRLLTRAQFLLLVAQGCICHLYCHYFREVILHFEQPLCHLSLFQQLYTLAMIQCRQISFQQHNVTHTEISWHFDPLLTFLQGLDKFLSPPTPKLITEMFFSSPPTSAIQIRFLENLWRRHHHLCLNCEHIIWRYWHWTLSIIDCLNSQWSRIFYHPTWQILVARTSRGRPPSTFPGRPLKILFDRPGNFPIWRPGDVLKWRPRDALIWRSRTSLIEWLGTSPGRSQDVP